MSRDIGARAPYDAHVNRLVAVILAMLVASVVAQGCSGKACSQDSDCSNGEACLYPIGSCSARGTCMTFPNPAGSGGCNSTAVQCADSNLVCGCGVTVMTGCNYPEGYAGGPTTGEQNCFSAGSTGGSGGGEGGVDASTSQEAGEAGQKDGASEEAVPPDGSGEETVSPDGE